MRHWTLCLLLSKALASTVGSAIQCNTYQFPSLMDADLEDLVAGLQKGWFTSVDLVKAYSARILEMNSTLHMVTEINPDALDLASIMDDMRTEGRVLSPLHGIPILVKNNIATNDRMQTTAGSWGLWYSRVPNDATVVEKLREAGAIILGKANLSQWAHFRSQNSSAGWSSHGGQTYGAYYPGQDPSGSSSGSGVASDLGLALACLGTETSGSILAPSDANNLVGIKPTVGLTSRYLVIPISEHQDTVGPMARTVKDAAYVLQAIAGIDRHDNYTSAIPNQGQVPDYVAACDPNALAGARIGVARNVLDLWSRFTDQPVVDAFNRALKQMEDAGATIVEANYTAFDRWSYRSASAVLAADFRTNLPSYLSKLTHNPNKLNNLEQVRTFTHGHPLEAWPERDTLAWDFSLNDTWDNTDPRFWPYYEDNLFYGGEGGILGALERTNVSAVVLPSQIAPPIPALVGSPAITVPMGFYPSDWNITLNDFGDLVATGPNMPFGISFMGAKFSEAELIGLAYAYEQRTMHRYDVKQYLAPSAELDDFKHDLFDNERSDKTCPSDWVERCQEVPNRPGVLERSGVPRKRRWWGDILEKGQKRESEASKERT